jgi:mannose-6-phosphate isomerase class I
MSPHILVALDGGARLESPGQEPITFSRGEAVVVPANVREYTVHPQWQVEFLTMELPAGKGRHPWLEDAKAVTG